tara:strand:- start:21347 stop:21892 length:546 start_codon:yes stop_codon:yes gene_type:complete
MSLSMLQTGNLVIRPLEEKLIIAVSGNAGSRAEIAIEDLPLIIEFLGAQKRLRTNRRAGFRLNISELPPAERNSFQVTALKHSVNIGLQPVDISLGGLYAASDTFIGRPGEVLHLLIAHDNVSITLPAQIVRTSLCSRKFAFRFINDPVSPADFEPPEELTAIFAALEACWLGASLDLQWY